MSRKRCVISVSNFLVIGLLSFVQPATVFGQEGGSKLEEIVVTSQRRAENVQDVPIAVTAIGAADIERLQIVNTLDIGQYVPNFQTRRGAGAAAGQYTMRGAGQSDSLPSLEPAIGMYVDDVYIARITSFIFPLKDLESIEVLRGPQGTLYGRNSMGGAVRMNSKRPDLTTASTQLEVGAGNLESYEVFGVHNQPLSDSTAFRVAGSYQTQDEGYVTAPNMPDGKVNTQNSYDLRASLLTTPNDKLSVLVRMSYSKVNADCCDGANLGDSTFLLPSGERDSNEDYDRSSFFTYPGTTKPVSDSDALSAVVDVTYDWGDVALRSITAYVDSSADLLLDYNLQGLILVQHLDSDQLSQEFQFQGKALADRLSWLVGAYYFTDDNQWFTSLGFPATGVSLGSEDLDTGADAYALFTNMNYAITDQLEAVVGLRYTNETKDISATGYSDLYGTVGPIWDDQTLEANGVPLDQDFSRLDPKVGLNYHFTADIMGYISWSQAFQSGGWSARVWANPNSFSAVGEQTVDATEIGVKALLLDDRLRFNAAVFWNDYDDIVVNRLEFLPNGALGTIAANAATASANGIELEAQFKISETLLATGSYSYIDSKIESVEGDTGFVTVGDPLDSTPESQFSLALEGNWPVSALSGSLTGRLGYSHTSLYFNGSAAEPVQQIPSLGLLDVTAGYESDDGWYAQAYCHNCSDEEYWQSRFSIGPYYPAYVGMPRTYGMRVGMRF